MSNVLKGKNGVVLNIGEIYKGVNRIIDSVWTTEFTVTSDGIFIINYNRNDQEGYDKERELLGVKIEEDEHRNIIAVKITDKVYKGETYLYESDTFKVINPKYIFSYKEPTYNELNSIPELKHLRSKYIANSYGIGEKKEFKMKHVLLFEAFDRKRISLEDFKKIESGTIVSYMGATYTVKENTGYMIKMTKEKNGKETVVNLNYAQFNADAIIKTEE